MNNEPVFFFRCNGKHFVGVQGAIVQGAVLLCAILSVSKCGLANAKDASTSIGIVSGSSATDWANSGRSYHIPQPAIGVWKWDAEGSSLQLPSKRMAVLNEILKGELSLSQSQMSALHDYREIDMKINMIQWSLGWTAEARAAALEPLQLKRRNAIDRVRQAIHGREQALDQWIEDHEFAINVAHEIAFGGETEEKRPSKVGVRDEMELHEHVLNIVHGKAGFNTHWSAIFSKDGSQVERAAHENVLVGLVQLEIEDYNHDHKVNDVRVGPLIVAVVENARKVKRLRGGL